MRLPEPAKAIRDRDHDLEVFRGKRRGEGIYISLRTVGLERRTNSGSFTKLAAILLASSRVRSFAQALLKRVLLKRVLGPALLKRDLGRVWLRPMHRLCSAAT
jgi:hypothetical protein